MLLLSIAIAALGIGLISLALIVALKNKQSAELNAVSQQLKDTS
jgi:hypothetical protein